MQVFRYYKECNQILFNDTMCTYKFPPTCISNLVQYNSNSASAMKSKDCTAINLKTLKLELILSRGFDGFGSYITGSKDEELQGEGCWLNYIGKQLLFIWENPCRMQTVRLHQHHMIYWKYQCSTPYILVQIMFLIILESIGGGREWLQAGIEAIKLRTCRSYILAHSCTCTMYIK